MIVLERLAGHELWSTLGLVLLHFLWQGTLVALLVASAARALGKTAARERYALFCTGLLALPFLPLVTWAYLSGQQPLGGVAFAPAPTGAVPNVDAYAVCGWAWLAGAAAFQVRLALAWFRATQLRRVGTALLEPAWQAELATLGARLGLRRAVRVFASNRIEVPALVGWFEPVVLVPAGALVQLTPDQLRAVLAHELAHLARFDPWVNALQSVIESLLFFHPAVWWLSTRIREEREYCCDDLAVEIVRDPIGYARALTSLESLRRQESALVLSSHGGSLMQRIRRITSRPQGAHGRQPLRFAPLVLSGLVLSLAGGSAHGWITSGTSADPHERGAEVSLPHDGHGSQEDVLRKREELERLRRRVAELRANLDRLEHDLGLREREPLDVADPKDAWTSVGTEVRRAPGLPTLEWRLPDAAGNEPPAPEYRRRLYAAALEGLEHQVHPEWKYESTNLPEEHRAEVPRFFEGQQGATETEAWHQKEATLRNAEEKQLLELHQRIRRDAGLRVKVEVEKRNAEQQQLLELHQRFRTNSKTYSEYRDAWSEQLQRNREDDALGNQDVEELFNRSWRSAFDRARERGERGSEPQPFDARFRAPKADDGADGGLSNPNRPPLLEGFRAYGGARAPQWPQQVSGEAPLPSVAAPPVQLLLPENIQEKVLQGWLEAWDPQRVPVSVTWPERRLPKGLAPDESAAPAWPAPFEQARGGAPKAPFGQGSPQFRAQPSAPAALEPFAEPQAEPSPEPSPEPPSASDAMRETKLLREQVRRLRAQLESLEGARGIQPN